MPDSRSQDSEREAVSASGLSFSDNCSIEWRPVEHSLDDDHLSMVNQSNEFFLRAVAALGTVSGELGEEEGVISAEIERLDRKINLVLDLVSQLVYKQLDIPDKCRVTISATDLVWQESNPPGAGELLFVQAYIQHGTPKPLCFYGEVTTTEADREGGRCRVRYVGLSPSVASWLEKLIFRHHRREVAFRRLQAGED
ncbi:MAG: hypothetical protein CME59_21695 [Halioglobus sp.]|nr:hypothetical protein [Halioglobus sp.]|tara:strand:- start:703 stop:1293 length:591 start_codon:yes stop_codon:yes gene_type:complete